MAPGEAGADRDSDLRAAFRAFVREHHPDVGGDPEVFAAGVAEFRAALARKQPDRDRATRSGPAADRFDAPIFVVPRPRGLRGLLHRFRTRFTRRNQPPRVR